MEHFPKRPLPVRSNQAVYVYTYADDHQIYHSGHDLEEVTFQLSASADQETKWYKSNLLVVDYEQSLSFLSPLDKTRENAHVRDWYYKGMHFAYIR